MDPNPQNQSDQEAQPKPVMDIQPPKPAATAPVVSDETELVVQSDAEAENTAAAEPEIAPVVSEAPTQEDTATSSTEVVEETNPRVETEPKTEETPPEQPALAAVAKPHKRSRTPILAVVIAVLVAGAFGVLAVLAYRNSQKPATNTDTSQQSTAKEESTEKATPADVDETIDEIDKALNDTDDEADFDDNSLSDTTLSL